MFFIVTFPRKYASEGIGLYKLK